MSGDRTVATRAPQGAPCHCPFDSKMVESMKKSMTDQLEQRRLAWERDVVRMQEEFFQGKFGEEGSAKLPALTFEPAGEESSADKAVRMLQPIQSESDELFKLRFNVRDYNPDDIHVRAEGDRLIVSAKHIEGDGPGSKITKQFSKQVDIPANVEILKMISYLTPDGILTVEAPLDKNIKVQTLPPCMNPLSPTSPEQLGSPKGTTATIQGTPHPAAIHFSNPFHDFPKPIEGGMGPPGNTTADILETEYGRMLRLNVDLRRRDYQPQEIKIKLYRNKIAVTARHEDTGKGKTTKREFNREFDIPEPLEPETVRALLDVSAGTVFIAASLSSNAKHNMISYLITQQQPCIRGKPVTVEKLY